MSAEGGLFDLDLAEAPWEYPGPNPNASGLLHGATYRRLSDGESFDDLLAGLGVAPVRKRTYVVAVGSNACPAVMRRKMDATPERPAVDGTIPFLAAKLHGVRAGHSAHISKGGYVAAVPVVDPSAEPLPVFVTLLDKAQLDRLRETEPNYLETTVTDPEQRLVLEGGEEPRSYLLWASKRGALGPRGEKPVPFCPDQADVFSVLAREFPAEFDLDGDLHAFMRALGGEENEERRRAIRKAFLARHWVRDTGYRDADALNGD